MNLTKEQALEQIENLKKFVENIGKPKLPELINGHWYTPTTAVGYQSSIYVYSKTINTLVNLEGGVWCMEDGFGPGGKHHGWVDVTKYHKIVKSNKPPHLIPFGYVYLPIGNLYDSYGNLLYCRTEDGLLYEYTHDCQGKLLTANLTKENQK